MVREVPRQYVLGGRDAAGVFVSLKLRAFKKSYVVFTGQKFTESSLNIYVKYGIVYTKQGNNLFLCVQ